MRRQRTRPPVRQARSTCERAARGCWWALTSCPCLVVPRSARRCRRFCTTACPLIRCAVGRCWKPCATISSTMELVIAVAISSAVSERYMLLDSATRRSMRRAWRTTRRSMRRAWRTTRCTTRNNLRARRRMRRAPRRASRTPECASSAELVAFSLSIMSLFSIVSFVLFGVSVRSVRVNAAGGNAEQATNFIKWCGPVVFPRECGESLCAKAEPE